MFAASAVFAPFRRLADGTAIRALFWSKVSRWGRVNVKVAALALLEWFGCLDRVKAFETYHTVILLLHDDLAILRAAIAVERLDDDFLRNDSLFDDHVLGRIAFHVAPQRTFRENDHCFFPYSLGFHVVHFLGDFALLLDFRFASFADFRPRHC